MKLSSSLLFWWGKRKERTKLNFMKKKRRKRKLVVPLPWPTAYHTIRNIILVMIFNKKPGEVDFLLQIAIVAAASFVLYM